MNSTHHSQTFDIFTLQAKAKSVMGESWMNNREEKGRRMRARRARRIGITHHARPVWLYKKTRLEVWASDQILGKLRERNRFQSVLIQFCIFILCEERRNSQKHNDWNRFYELFMFYVLQKKRKSLAPVSIIYFSRFCYFLRVMR